MKTPWWPRAAFALAVAVSVAASSSSGPSEGTLVSAPEMSAKRAAHTATALLDGRVLVAGGFTEKGSAKGAELYDAEAARFISLPPMHTTRHSHTSTLLPDGRVLIAGGYGEGTKTLASAELFDPRGAVFALVGGEPRMAGQFSAAALLKNGSALITGGYGNGGGPRSAAWLYQP
jgi:Galactose oxidase, central domain